MCQYEKKLLYLVQIVLPILWSMVYMVYAIILRLPELVMNYVLGQYYRDFTEW